MGLDTSHGAWHGAYSAFMRWREEIARVAGLPPLKLMDGFYGGINRAVFLDHTASELSRSSLERLEEQLPISWDCLRPDPLHILLRHSDSDGEIAAQDCGPIADSLELLLPKLTGNLGGHIGDIHEKTVTFINGLRLAADSCEPLDFH
jgi:hypothetical protein